MLSDAEPDMPTLLDESTGDVPVIVIVGRVESSLLQRIRSACSEGETSALESSWPTLELPPPQPASVKAATTWVIASTT